jgi:hypothetical protein
MRIGEWVHYGYRPESKQLFTRIHGTNPWPGRRSLDARECSRLSNAQILATRTWLVMEVFPSYTNVRDPTYDRWKPGRQMHLQRSAAASRWRCRQEAGDCWCAELPPKAHSGDQSIEGIWLDRRHRAVTHSSKHEARMIHRESHHYAKIS